MNFLGVGPLELVLILVVALVFVGPERLPKLAADLARTIREIRKYTGSLAAEFNEVIQEFEKDTQGERSAWKEIETGITGATKSVTEAVRDVRSEVQGAKSDASAPVAGASVASVASVAAVQTSGAPSDPTSSWSDVRVGLPPGPAGNSAANGAHSSNGNGNAPDPPTAPVDEAR